MTGLAGTLKRYGLISVSDVNLMSVSYFINLQDLVELEASLSHRALMITLISWSRSRKCRLPSGDGLGA